MDIYSLFKSRDLSFQECVLLAQLSKLKRKKLQLCYQRNDRPAAFSKELTIYNLMWLQTINNKNNRYEQSQLQRQPLNTTIHRPGGQVKIIQRGTQARMTGGEYRMRCAWGERGQPKRMAKVTGPESCPQPISICTYSVQGTGMGGCIAEKTEQLCLEILL